jgi:hypothetical protein
VFLSDIKKLNLRDRRKKLHLELNQVGESDFALTVRDKIEGKLLKWNISDDLITRDKVHA